MKLLLLILITAALVANKAEGLQCIKGAIGGQSEICNEMYGMDSCITTYRGERILEDALS